MVEALGIYSFPVGISPISPMGSQTFLESAAVFMEIVPKYPIRNVKALIESGALELSMFTSIMTMLAYRSTQMFTRMSFDIADYPEVLTRGAIEGFEVGIVAIEGLTFGAFTAGLLVGVCKGLAAVGWRCY